MITICYFLLIYEKNVMTCYLLTESMPDSMGILEDLSFYFHLL